MTSFLHLVASDLKRRLHNDLSRTVIIFPNKRAGLFLNDFFTPEDDHPTWMPRYMSIREFFATLSDKTTADPIETVCRLYDHYRRLTGSEESLDFFYAWGERLLADFDDVDKNMADPSKIFRDLRDYAETGGFEVLTEEQITQLHTFSKDFAKEKLTVVRQNFVRLWNVILPLYHALREDLAADGLAYEGQLYREAAEQLKAGTATLPVGIEHVVFVGFNVIDRVEQTLFEALSAAGKALFYWDYDVSYARRCGDVRHEAGTFLQENLQRFPNALEETNEAFNNFLRNREKKVIEYAAASTDRGQVQSIEEWLSDSDNFDKKEARETAIVLCDEGLLQPLLHTLPRTINEVNITKGFPLPHTPVFAFIVQEMEAMEDELDQQATTFYSQKKKHGASAATFQLPEGKECIPYLERLVTKIEEETRRITGRVAEDVVLSNLYNEAFSESSRPYGVFSTSSPAGILRSACPRSCDSSDKLCVRVRFPSTANRHAGFR